MSLASCSRLKCWASAKCQCKVFVPGMDRCEAWFLQGSAFDPQHALVASTLHGCTRSCPRFLVVVTTILHLLFVCGGRALRVWCCGGRALRVWCCGGELRSLLWCRVGSFVLVCTMWWAAAASLCGGFFFVWLWSSAASCGLLLLPCVYGLAGVSQRHAPVSRAEPECHSRGTKGRMARGLL